MNRLRRFLDDTDRPTWVWVLMACVSTAFGIGLVAMVRWVGLWG